MDRVEQLAEYLKRYLPVPVIVGGLGDTKLPAVIVNNLDVIEPEGAMQIQIDGWVEIEWCELTNDTNLKRKSREIKAVSKELLDAIVAAVQSYTERVTVHRTLDRACNDIGNRRRVTVNIEMEPALLESNG